MSDRIAEIFNSFQTYLVNEEVSREEIRAIVRDLEKNSRDILMILQNIHNEDNMKESLIIHEYCATSRVLFGHVRNNYARLADVVPKNQYYKYHDQWRFVTQKLCFLASLIIYLEIKVLLSRDTAAEMLGVSSDREDGFHLDLEDYLMGLLQLSAELSRFAVNSVTNGDYNRPIEIAQFINDLSAGFRLLNLKNDSLRKRFDGLKYAVKKVEEVVYDLSIRGLKPNLAVEDTKFEASDLIPAHVARAHFADGNLPVYGKNKSQSATIVSALCNFDSVSNLSERKKRRVSKSMKRHIHIV